MTDSLMTAVVNRWLDDRQSRHYCSHSSCLGSSLRPVILIVCSKALMSVDYSNFAARVSILLAPLTSDVFYFSQSAVSSMLLLSTDYLYRMLNKPALGRLQISIA
jgi:hypothetical protein